MQQNSYLRLNIFVLSVQYILLQYIICVCEYFWSITFTVLSLSVKTATFLVLFNKIVQIATEEDEW